MPFKTAIFIRTRFSASLVLPPNRFFSYSLYFRCSTTNGMSAANNDTSSLSDAINTKNWSLQGTYHPLSLMTRCQCSKHNSLSNFALPEIQLEQSSQPHNEFCSCDFIFFHSHSSEFLNITLHVSLFLFQLFVRTTTAVKKSTP